MKPSKSTNVSFLCSVCAVCFHAEWKIENRLISTGRMASKWFAVLGHRLRYADMNGAFSIESHNGNWDDIVQPSSWSNAAYLRWRCRPTDRIDERTFHSFSATSVSNVVGARQPNGKTAFVWLLRCCWSWIMNWKCECDSARDICNRWHR